MKLSNDRFELAGTAKIFHYLLQDVSSHRIEGLGQINDGPKEVAMLLPSILLELEWGEYHVGMQFGRCERKPHWFSGRRPCKMLDEAVKQDAGQDLASN